MESERVSDDDGIKIQMGIHEGAIPVPEGSDVAVGSWTCPEHDYTYGPVRSSTPCLTNVVVQCPYCGRTAEIAPEIVV